MKWSKDSWKNFEAKQMPAYADQGIRLVIEELSSMPPLIFAGETRSLKSQIYQVQKESPFIYKAVTVLSFQELNNTIRDNFKLLLKCLLF